MKKIFLVEDDQSLGDLLSDYLNNIGFGVTLVKSGAAAIAAFKKDVFDLCILDIMLPGKDGFTLAREILKMDDGMPVIFLTARVQAGDRIKGLKIGADDYLTKPFNIKELELRIKNILKRTNGSKTEFNDEIKIGEIKYYPKIREIEACGKIKRLSKKEASLLWILYENKNQFVERDRILKKIWNMSDYYTARSMDVYIAKLRKLLKADPRVKIENLHGTGFKLAISS